MTKSELIEKIAEKNPHLLLKDVERIVNVVFEKITMSLARGERVEFRGFGAFSFANGRRALPKIRVPANRSRLRKGTSPTSKPENSCTNY